ncbi:CPBP family intramembrane glutamic endopeptidase [Abyssisolibacter fermentans]|uniref:CPBP family intramembrane glutamic endopeptidase n=1 Tax=Abyssisolibacter fermentans TaxID=1766203 RepID=UPI00082D53B1|nr:CPBP family intramembrane glutamic endopeptidase [Abyssisolibacter fermentans]
MNRLQKLFKIIAIIVLSFIGFIIIDSIFSIAVHFLLNKSGIKVKNYFSWWNFAILITRTCITFLYIKIVFKIVKVNKKSFHTNKKNLSVVILSSIVFGMLLISIIIGLRYSFDMIDSIHIKIISAESISLGIICTLVSVTYEELIFRLFYINILENIKLNDKIIMFVTSALFTVLHPLSVQGLLGWITLFLFALILYYVYKKINFYACVSIHFGWNFISSGGNIIKIKYLTNTDIQLLFSKGISIIVLLTAIIIITIYNKKKNVYEKLEA